MYCCCCFLQGSWFWHSPIDIGIQSAWLHRMIKLGLSIDEDGATGDDDKTNMPALEEDVDKSNQMEEVD